MLLGQAPEIFPKEEGCCIFRVLVFKELLELGVELHHQGMPTVYRVLVVSIAHQLKGGLDSLNGFWL